MSTTATAPTNRAAEQAAVDRNAELFQGYVLAQMEDPERMERVPDGTTLVFLPRDDPAGTEAALTMATDIARRGYNVYLRNVDRNCRPI